MMLAFPGPFARVAPRARQEKGAASPDPETLAQWVREARRGGGGGAGCLGALGDPATEQWARDTMREAFTEHYGRAPSLEELQAVQALGRHEGHYGLGWSDRDSPVTGVRTSMEGSNNWGAVMCTQRPVDNACPSGCGYWFDSRPTASGQVQFEACFKRYATPKDGAIGILEVFDRMPSVIAALPSGDLDEIAYQMRLNRYFLGFKVDPWEASQEYASALDKHAQIIADALGETRVATRKGGAKANPGGYTTTTTEADPLAWGSTPTVIAAAAGVTLAALTLGPRWLTLARAAFRTWEARGRAK